MSEEIYQRLVDTKETYEEELLRKDGVHAVGIGYKIFRGEQTNKLAIVVFTESKKDNKDIPYDQRIPKSFDGILSDVVEVPPFEPFSINNHSTAVMADNKKYRPVPGGVEMYTPTSPTKGGLCTIGMFANSRREEDNPDDIYLLTNAHCLVNKNQEVRQPESNDPLDTIAYASRRVDSETVDGAIAKMIRNEDADPYYILDVGVPRGSYNVSISNLNDNVIKHGRTTETTVGFIAYVDVSVNGMLHQIVINSDITFAAPGDSGSVVLMLEGTEKHKVIGLLWGGVLTYATLSPIEAVSRELEIELLTLPS